MTADPSGARPVVTAQDRARALVWLIVHGGDRADYDARLANRPDWQAHEARVAAALAQARAEGEARRADAARPADAGSSAPWPDEARVRNSAGRMRKLPEYLSWSNEVMLGALGEIDRLREIVAELEDRDEAERIEHERWHRRRAEDGLRYYGQHKAECARVYPTHSARDACSCGLDDALAESAAAARSAPGEAR